MGSLDSLESLDRKVSLPPGSWDIHVHVFDSSLGQFSPSRAYTPAQAKLTELVNFVSGLGQDRRPANIVLVQPSPYHVDNTVVLASLKHLRDTKCCTARGIAVVDLDKITDEELWHMHVLGIRGLRLNMKADGKSVDGEGLRKMIQDAASRIRYLPEWKLQLFCSASMWDEIYDTILNLPVQVIADHMGGLLGSSKLQINGTGNLDPRLQEGYESLVRLAEQSKVFIKISGLYRLSTQTESGHSDLEPLIRDLAARVPDSLIWASDWPHTGEGVDRLDKNLGRVEKFRHVDNRLLLANVRKWVGTEETWNRMMIHTPNRVYL
ncbi:transcriptional family amidohydrolase family [Fusarium albosuccineum]|uniref:Transcriptional family amidohydrolase family n=1 Tax=Fusarium albosuccineum TaxID=1237068 RepID=A0A8H4LQA7_9HYPO|nr:transcriptional family amidohydrolase family [Fusarium albosuccineum]